MPWVRESLDKRKLVWVKDDAVAVVKEDGKEIQVRRSPEAPAVVKEVAVPLQAKILNGEVVEREDRRRVVDVVAANLCESARWFARSTGANLLLRAVVADDRRELTEAKIAQRERAREERIEMYRARVELLRARRQRIELELKGLSVGSPAGAAGGSYRLRLPK